MKEKSGSKKRTSSVIFGAVAIVFSRGMGQITQFIGTGFLARYLTPEEFGLWSIFSIAVLYFGSFDFGIGGGLRNRLASMSVTEKIDENQKIYFLSSGYCLFYLSIFLITLCLCFAPYVPWAGILNINEGSLSRVVNVIFAIVFISTLIKLPLSTLASGFYAYQETHIKSIFDVLELVILLFAQLIGVYFHVSFIKFVFIYYLMYSLASLPALFFFLKKRKWRLGWISWLQQKQVIRDIGQEGLLFWAQNLCALAVYSTSPLIVSSVLSIAQAGEYSAIQRCFCLILGIHSTILTPLWSAYTQAASTGDWLWIKNALRTSTLITFCLFIIGGGAFYLYGGVFCKLWLGKEVGTPRLMMLMGIWAFLYGWGNCLSILLNGLSLLKWQLIGVAASAVLNLSLSFLWGRHYGTEGVAVAAIISTMPSLVTLALMTRRVLRQKNQIQIKLKI